MIIEITGRIVEWYSPDFMIFNAFSKNGLKGQTYNVYFDGLEPLDDRFPSPANPLTMEPDLFEQNAMNIFRISGRLASRNGEEFIIPESVMIFSENKIITSAYQPL